MTRDERIAQAARRSAKRAELAALERAISDFVTIDEFAAMAKMSTRTLFRLKARQSPGFPREYRPSGRPLFKRPDVRAWLDSRAI